MSTITTYKGSCSAWGIRQFPRPAGSTCIALKPKQPEKYIIAESFYDAAQTQPAWLLGNQTPANLQFEVQVIAP